MADTFSNDLRLRLQESGSNAGTWGDLLNGTITNIASALGQGSEAIPNASTHTITLADGTADEARSLYLKCTGGGQACTVTLGPNTISKVWIIDNATSYTLTFSQGSGANVAIAAGAVKVIATDGAGSGAAVVDTLDGLEGLFSSLAVTGGLTVDTNTLVVDATNNRVGIGISPLQALHVNSGTGNSAAIFESTDATSQIWIKDSNSSSTYQTGIACSGDNLLLNNGGERIRVTTTGVGIGTTDADSKLKVELKPSGTVLASLRVGYNGTSVNYLDGDTNIFRNGVGNAERMIISSTGVTIGSVAAGASSATPVELNLGSTFADSLGSLSKAKLKLFEDSSTNVYGLSVSSGFLEFGVPTSAKYAFFVNESEQMRLSGGNLLVGKTSAAIAGNGNWFSGAGPMYSSIPGSTNTLHVYNTTESLYKFYVMANGGISNYQSNNVNISDEREKKNIETLESQWDSLKQWSLKKFHYNADDDSESKKYGVIAQEVETHNPEVVADFMSTETETRLAVKEQQMMWLAIKALQEAQTRIETLEAKVQTLENTQ
tara:strand:+ start:199 stop:1839 length:1641 start_codon:yes stop_codon:yes gene_type:complete